MEPKTDSEKLRRTIESMRQYEALAVKLAKRIHVGTCTHPEIMSSTLSSICWGTEYHWGTNSIGIECEYYACGDTDRWTINIPYSVLLGDEQTIYTHIEDEKFRIEQEKQAEKETRDAKAKAAAHREIARLQSKLETLNK